MYNFWMVVVCLAVLALMLIVTTVSHFRALLVYSRSGRSFAEYRHDTAVCNLAIATDTYSFLQPNMYAAMKKLDTVNTTIVFGCIAMLMFLVPAIFLSIGYMKIVYICAVLLLLYAVAVFLEELQNSSQGLRYINSNS